MKTLHVISDRGPNGITRELDLLVSAHRGDPLDVRVHCLSRRHWFDLRELWSLATSLRDFQPDQIIAWGLAAFRGVRLAMPSSNTTILVRKPMHSGRRWLSHVDRWLLRRADRILISSNGEAGRCVANGLPAEKLSLVPPGVRSLPAAKGDDKLRIVCAGALLPHRGFYEAIWAFDMLHFAHTQIQLTIAGKGPQRPRLEEFAQRASMEHCIHLPGQLTDISPVLARGAIAWVPSLTDSGAGVALEAMAAGLPVVAARIGALAEIVVDGETGFLVEPGDQMALARQTRRLLVDEDLRAKMGAAGRRRAETVYSPDSFVSAWTRACEAARNDAQACFSLKNAIRLNATPLSHAASRKSA